MKKTLLILIISFSLSSESFSEVQNSNVQNLKAKKIKSVYLEAHRQQQVARQKEIEKVSKGMERLFLKHMIEQMRKTVPDSDLIKKSNGEKIYQGMLDDEYAKLWSRHGGIGLSDIVSKQLGGGKNLPFPPKNAPSRAIKKDFINRQNLKNN
jgi:Rod binding domain-containing protein